MEFSNPGMITWLFEYMSLSTQNVAETLDAISWECGTSSHQKRPVRMNFMICNTKMKPFKSQLLGILLTAHFYFIITYNTCVWNYLYEFDIVVFRWNNTSWCPGLLQSLPEMFCLWVFWLQGWRSIFQAWLAVNAVSNNTFWSLSTSHLRSNVSSISSHHSRCASAIC